MAPNPQHDGQDNDCRTEIPVGPTTTVDVGVCWDQGVKFDDSGERLLNVDTRRVGGDSAWVQFGPTSNPGKPDGPYFGRDTDGDGYGNYGMQWYLPTKHVAAGVSVVAGVVATGAAVATVATASTGVGVVVSPIPGVVTAVATGVAAGAGAVAVVSDIGNIHQAIAFDVEPGALLDQAKDKVGDFLDDLLPDLPSLPFPPNPFPTVPPGFPRVGGNRISDRSQSLEMSRVSEAFARLQSLL